MSVVNLDEENYHNILPKETFLEMLKTDEQHEAFGAMYHRQLVEERTNTRNYHNDIKMALDVAVEGLERIVDIGWVAGEHNTLGHATTTLDKIKEILK